MRPLVWFGIFSLLSSGSALEAQLKSSDVPEYDVKAYCLKVSEAIGGSYVIEKTCRDQESEGLSRAEARSIPSRVARYCDEVSRAIGGSYVIYNSCVDQELEAAAKL